MKFSFTKSYPRVCSKLVSSISVRFQRNAISFTTGSNVIGTNSSFKTTWIDSSMLLLTETKFFTQIFGKVRGAPEILLQ